MKNKTKDMLERSPGKTLIEVGGPDLAECLGRIRQQGGRVTGMAMAGVGGWKLEVENTTAEMWAPGSLIVSSSSPSHSPFPGESLQR